MAAKKRNNSVVGTSHIRSVCSPTTPIVGLTNVHSVLYDIPEHCDPQLHLVLIKPADYSSSETWCTLYGGTLRLPKRDLLAPEDQNELIDGLYFGPYGPCEGKRKLKAGCGSTTVATFPHHERKTSGQHWPVQMC